MRYLFLGFIYIYRYIVGPALHFTCGILGIDFQCKYPVSCSTFAADELKTNTSVYNALRNTMRRILSCGPWGFFHKILRIWEIK